MIASGETSRSRVYFRQENTMADKIKPMVKPGGIACKCGIPNCQGHRMTEDGKALITQHPHFDKKK